MESFHDPLGDAEDRERQYAAYRSDPEWQRVFSFLRDGYWHVTSPKAWEAIRESGVIKPNIGGQFPMRFEDNTLRSFGFIHKCVSLFDFVSPSEEEVIRQWANAWEVLTSDQEDTILIRLDRPRLMPEIIPNLAASIGKVLGHIPFCEVWYPEEIPTNANTGVFRVPPESGFGEFHPQRIS